MDKKEILIELKKAKKEYLKAINIDFDYWRYIKTKGLYYGFCGFFSKNPYIINELRKDLTVVPPPGNYWYTFASLPDNPSDSIDEALKPRLEHLKRTIKRLEKELKNQPTI